MIESSRTNVYHQNSHNQQIVLLFVVLVYVAVVRFLICGLAVFEKQEGVAFFVPLVLANPLLFAVRFMAKSRVGQKAFWEKAQSRFWLRAA